MASIGERKADKDLYNDNAHDFIPVVCHYDERTLLTKNGHLIQMIEITGIDSEVISDKLGSLRQSIKKSLKTHMNSSDIACWIHTVRHEKNLDDNTHYNNKFAADFHESWVVKNRLRTRFVNTLYISIVSKPKSYTVDSVDGFIDTSFLDTVSNKNEHNLSVSFERVTTVVKAIMTDLADYIPKQLGITFDGDKCFAEMLYVYKYIISLRAMQTEVILHDFSEVIIPEHYAVGGNKIEIVEDGKKKFASILSLKEYTNDENDELLEKMLQLQVEFIATEIMFAVDRKIAQEPYAHQHYILEVSRDAEVKSAKMLDRLFGTNAEDQYLMQQLSVMVIADDTAKLEADTTKVSKSLSLLGFVNVREDINLENIFWSQLPGNAKFMRRHNANVFDSSCAFVSIQNTPTGQRASKWGKAVTVIQTESGTPYFLNFHNGKQTGHTCIYGNAHIGKSVLMNFLISEAMKYDPTIVYLALDNSSDVFIKALGGQWHHDIKIPVLVDKTYVIVGMMVDIVSGQYSRICTDEEKSLIKKLLAAINASGSYDAALKTVRNFEFPPSCSVLQNSILSVIKYLDEFNVQVTKGSITGINLQNLDTKENMDLRSAFVIASLRSLCFDKTSPKILVIDEMTHLLDHPYYAHYIGWVLDIAKAHNIAVIGTVDTDEYINNTSQKKLWGTLLENLDLQIVMHHKNISYDLKTIFGLTEYEVRKLGASEDKRRFIVKPSGSPSTICEFGISSVSHVMNILSCDENGRKKCDEIIASHGNKPEEFLPELYKALK